MSNNGRAKKPGDSTRGERKGPDPAKIAAEALKSIRGRRMAERGDTCKSEALVPTSSVVQALAGKNLPAWGLEYLEALEKTRGAKKKAAELIGLSYSAVHKAGLSHPDLDDAIRQIRALYDDQNLDELGNLSMLQAMKPGNITERIFNLKALDPSRYRDHAQPTTPVINIVMGFTIPDVPETSGQVMDDEPDDLELPTYATVIDAEEVKPTRNIRRRPPDDILEDGDVDIRL